MMSQLVQFLLAGMTVGSTYALAALGYTFVYSASGMINFAQGEFIMLGAMSASALVAAGVPLLPALVVAIAFTTLVGIALAKLAIEPARNASITSLIIITLGSGQVILPSLSRATPSAVSEQFSGTDWLMCEPIDRRVRVSCCTWLTLGHWPMTALRQKRPVGLTSMSHFGT